jgi:hypothetical protein
MVILAEVLPLEEPYPLDDIETLNDLAEDDVLAIQPTSLLSADEELGAVASELSAAVVGVLEDAGG